MLSFSYLLSNPFLSPPLIDLCRESSWLMHESHLPWMRCPYSATCCWRCWLWLCIRESFQFSISGSCYLSCLQTKPLLSEVFLSAAGTNWHTSLVHKSQTAANKDFWFFFQKARRRWWAFLISYFIIVWDSFHTALSYSNHIGHVFHFLYSEALTSWGLADPGETVSPGLANS